MKAMILAAGKGTRMGSLTEKQPKALVRFNGKPMIENLIVKLKNSGYNCLLINIHHFGEQIIDFVKENNNFGIDITFSDERNELLDTGGAVLKAASFFQGTEPVLIHNVDIWTDLDLKVFAQWFQKSNAVAGLVVKERRSSRKLLFDSRMQLTGWKNSKTGEIKISGNNRTGTKEYAYSGIWMCRPEFIPLIPYTGCFSIIDAWLAIAKKHKISGYADKNSRWFDLGSPEKLKNANRLIAED